MMKQLLFREWRATWKLATFTTIGALFLMTMFRWNLHLWLQFSWDEACLSMPWILSSVIHLLITWQIFGREWQGRGRRVSAALATNTKAVCAAKFIMLLFFAAAVTTAIAGTFSLWRDIWPNEALERNATVFTSLKFLQAQVGLLAFMTCSALLIPNGAGAIIGALALGSIYFLAFVWLNDVYLVYHDISEDTIWQVLPASAAYLSLIFFLIAASMFLGGRLHRRQIKRSLAIALGIILLVWPIGQTWVQAEVKAWEDFDINSPAISIHDVTTLRDSDRIAMTLFRAGRAHYNTALFNLKTNTMDRVLPRMSLFRHSLEDASLEFRDLGNHSTGPHFNPWDQERAPSATLLPTGELQRGAIDCASSFTPGSIVYHLKSKRAWVGDGLLHLEDEKTNIKITRTLPPFTGPVSWQNKWIYADVVRVEDLTTAYCLHIVGKFDHDERVVELPRAWVPSPYMEWAGPVGVSKNGRAYYIDTDRRQVLELDLRTNVVRSIFRAEEKDPPLSRVFGDGDPNLLLVVRGDGMNARSSGILNIKSGRLRFPADPTAQFARWSSYTPMSAGRSPDRKFSLIFTKNGRAANYVRLDTLEEVVPRKRMLEFERLGLLSGHDRFGSPWATWTGNATLVLWTRKKVFTYDLAADDFRTVWEVKL